MGYIPEGSYREVEDYLGIYQSKFADAKPFKHIVLDDFFNSKKLYEVYKLFPGQNEAKWWHYNNVLEKKLANNQLHELPDSINHLISEMQSYRFVSLLEKITGIHGLIVDHTLNGGGLHQILPGGKLDIHADYNYHPITRLDRRVNVLLYLNHDWVRAYGGELELWRADMSVCEARIEPIFNRLVIFEVNDTAFHGHPDPFMGDTTTRKSIALYFYTNGRPKHETTEPHSTIFKRRPQDPIDEEVEQFRQKRAIKRI